jgi:hypothetical protein
MEALRFFRESRGTGESAIDVSAFFKSRKNLQKDFAKFLKGAPENRRQAIEKSLAGFKAAIETFEE